MRKLGILIMLVTVFALTATAVHAAITSCSIGAHAGTPYNHVDFNISCDGDGWTHVTFRDGAETDVLITAGVGSTSHSYDYLGGDFSVSVQFGNTIDIVVASSAAAAATGSSGVSSPPRAPAWCTDGIRLVTNDNWVVIEGVAHFSNGSYMHIDWDDQGAVVDAFVDGDAFRSDHHYSDGPHNLTITPLGGANPCFSAFLEFQSNSLVTFGSETATCQPTVFAEGDSNVLPDPRCRWFVFVRDNSLWWGYIDGRGPWQIEIEGVDPAVLAQGLIEFTGTDGERHLTDRYTTFIRDIEG